MSFSRTRVKICGVRDAATAAAASAAGADALGFVFYPASPRAVSPAQAVQALQGAASLVTSVGLFVDPDAEHVESVLARCALDCLQFHGDETPQFCASFGRPYLKAIRIRPGLDVAARVAEHRAARAILFDAWCEHMPGGTGETFAWERVPAMTRPWVLAGGLTAANAGAAVRRLGPPALDVSGGVERRRGEKDPELIHRFMQAVRRADARRLQDGARDSG